MGRPSIAISGMSPIGWRPTVALAGGGGGDPDPEATLWVHPVFGDDSRTKATVAASGGTLPWATLGRAVWGSTSQGSPNTAEAADAGDVVSVAAGTYSAPGKAQRNDPAFNPANSGTSGNPITFRADGTVNVTLSSGSGPIIGAYVRDYIVWDGFVVDEANGVSEPDTGSVVFWDCDGSGAEWLEIDGNGDGHGEVDNHTGIRFEVVTGGFARNCTIRNVTSLSANPNNGAGIMVYGCENLVLEHNDIADCGSGIFLKGGPNGGWTSEIVGHTVRFNKIANCESTGIAAYAGTPAAAGTPTLIYQNLVTGCEMALRYWFFNDLDEDPRDTFFINNTAYNCQDGLAFIGTPAGFSHGLKAWNNIFSVMTNGISSESTTFHEGDAECAHEHNIYHSVSGAVASLNGGSTTVTLANWKLTPYFHDAVSPAGSSSDPLFVSAGSNFRLQVGSYALTQGRVTNGIGGTNGDTIPAGCYVTGGEDIGLEV